VTIRQKIASFFVTGIAGIVVGASFSIAYFAREARLETLRANDELILTNLISLSGINGNDRDREQVKYLIEIKLAEQIETANTAALGRGESAKIAKTSLARVNEWHAKNPQSSMICTLFSAVERSKSIAN
jgi:hypothetical protein